MVGIKWLKLYGKPELSMYPAHYANAARKSRTRTEGCCLQPIGARQPQVTRAIVSICVTKRTSRSRTAQMRRGRVSAFKELLRWFMTAVETYRRFHKISKRSWLNVTFRVARKPCGRGIGKSAVKSGMYNTPMIKNVQ